VEVGVIVDAYVITIIAREIIHNDFILLIGTLLQHVRLPLLDPQRREV